MSKERRAALGIAHVRTDIDGLAVQRTLCSDIKMPLQPHEHSSVAQVLPNLGRQRRQRGLGAFELSLSCHTVQPLQHTQLGVGRCVDLRVHQL